MSHMLQAPTAAGRYIMSTSRYIMSTSSCVHMWSHHAQASQPTRRGRWDGLRRCGVAQHAGTSSHPNKPGPQHIPLSAAHPRALPLPPPLPAPHWEAPTCWAGPTCHDHATEEAMHHSGARSQTTETKLYLVMRLLVTESIPKHARGSRAPGACALPACPNLPRGRACAPNPRCVKSIGWVLR